MITEKEFYRRKIFLKEKKGDLQKQYPNQLQEINTWYNCDNYKEIQQRKSFLENKLKKAQELENENFEITGEFLYKFYNWSNDKEKVCYYCDIKESDLDSLHTLPGHINKRYPKRGKSLEIDRKDSYKPYSDINNLVFACYWCNNAKTDTFSAEEFIPIGKEISKIWEKRWEYNKLKLK